MATPLNHVEVFTSGLQQKVDVRGLEKELVRLWKSAAEAGESGIIQPVTRAAVITLIAVVEGDDAATAMTGSIARITEHAPCRALLVNVVAGELTPEFSAWVTAHCHRLSGGRQVCCEQVTISSSQSGVPHLAGLIVPLLIPDLPVFIYWPSLLAGTDELKQPEFELLDRLSENADYIMIDSAVAGDPVKAVQWMARVATQTGVHEEPRDLNWSRLLPWREAIADLFEPPELRPWLRDAVSVELEASHGPAPAGEASDACPVRPLFLLMWFTGRLGWTGAAGQHSNAIFDVAFENNRSGRIVLVPGEEARGRVGRVTFRFTGDRSVEVVRPSEHEFVATLRTGREEPVRKTLPRHVQSEATLLCGELDRRGSDPVFRSTLLGTAGLLETIDRAEDSGVESKGPAPGRNDDAGH